jgi:apyrase
VEGILNTVDNLLSNKDFCPFRYTRGFSKVITGQDEAIYLWVTVNFLKGRFSGGPALRTYGTLDMGGASTQNAFKVGTRMRLSILHNQYF